MSIHTIKNDIRRAANLIIDACSCVVITGAGISTASGIPDFRSMGSGLWTKHNPLEVASLTIFRQHPERFFDWLRPFAKKMLHALPNSAHFALANIENAGFIDTIITQNIDGLHQRAGSKKVLEVHGTINTLTCTVCYKIFDAESYLSQYIDHGEIPFCRTCGGILKPDPILLEEQLPITTWLAATKAVDSCDLLIITGSSLAIMPVAGLPVRALQNGAKIIIINQSTTYVDEQAECVITGDVSEIMPILSDQIIEN